MKFTLFLSALVFTIGAYAAPVGDDCECVTQDQANTLITRFIGFLDHKGSDLGNATQTAEAILHVGYTEVSDSVDTLAGFPVSYVAAVM